MNPALARLRWKLIVTSLVALVLAGSFFYLSQWVYAFSDDQCTWTPVKPKGGQAKILITEILPEGVAEQAGLLEGDVLLEIQGRKVVASRKGTRDAQKQINAQPKGRVLLYTVRRNEEILRVPVRLVKPFNRSALILLISGLTAWMLGLVVVLSSPQRKIARHFYYLGVCSLLLPLASPSFLGTWPDSLAILRAFIGNTVEPLLAALWVHFFLRFPYPFPLRKNHRFLLIVYALALVTAFLNITLFLLGYRDGDFRHSILSPLELEEAGRAIQVFLTHPWVRTPFLIYSSICLGVGMVYFWLGAIKLPPKRRRALLPAMIVTIALVVDFIAFRVLASQQGASLLFQRQAWVFLTPLPFLPLAFAYGVVRHGLFDVRKAILRWVSYFAVLGTVVVLYLGGISALFAYGFQSIPPVWMGAILGLTALPIGWLLRALLQWLRRRFHRDLPTTPDIVLGGLRETRRRFNQEALLRRLEETLQEGFSPQRLDILAFEGDTLILPGVDGPMGYHPPRKLKVPPGLIRLARENRELVLGLGPDEADWIGEQGAGVRAHVDALEVQIMILLLANDAPYKGILLGGKYAELNYGREDRELLREVGIVGGLVLETALLHKKLLDQGRIEQELLTARRIQESLITSQSPDMKGFQMALRLEPALETGGDLLWVKCRPHRTKGHCWLAAVGDVSGKGMAAALYMSQATALLEFATQKLDQPLEEILVAMDEALRTLMGSRDFLTLTLLEWTEDGSYRLARAGHPPALHVSGSKIEEIKEVNPFGRGLGLRPAGPKDWQILEGHLAPREWLVLYSDGLTEAMNQAGELFGLTRLQDQIRRVWGTGSPRAATEAIFREVSAFETQNRDDRTLLILGREP